MSASNSLISAGNTYNPCLLILKEKGYQLSAEESADRMLWNAAQGDRSFCAYSPPELLGIVVLWEHFGSSWNKQKPDLIGELLEAGQT